MILAVFILFNTAWGGYEPLFPNFNKIEKKFSEINQRAICFQKQNKSKCLNTLAQNFYFKISQPNCDIYEAGEYINQNVLEPLEESQVEFNSFSSLKSFFGALGQKITRSRTLARIEKLEIMTKKLIMSRLLLRTNKEEFTDFAKNYTVNFINVKHKDLRDPYQVSYEYKTIEETGKQLMGNLIKTQRSLGDVLQLMFFKF